MRVTLMHNPRLGDEAHSAEALTTLITNAGHDVLYQSTKESDWRAALRRKTDLVVVAGGDGTVAKVFTALASHPRLVTLLPTGTGNNIARSLGYPVGDVKRLVRSWPKAGRMRFALGRLSTRRGERLFVESAGGGVFAEVLRRTDGSGERLDGQEKFDQGLHLLEEVVGSAKARRWELSVDGEDLSGEYLGLELMNIREIGPNIPLAPVSDPQSAQLEVVFIRAEDRGALARFVQARLAGKRPPTPRLTMHSGSRIQMRPPSACRLHLDDRLLSKDERGPATSTVKVAAGAAWLDLLAPGTA